ncbi:uncharacterized protein LOC127809005 isoform X1 [Diospyros lotus]|uniref:uncharacterized protein LOC127809005 isoform X1 n=1 Tax=Diospyros lotus TaxID=55363 RepID=UPI00225A3A84|nr:uncharacterized protein LOC127809005 isoform X1 [Diospyros lotus]
MIFLGGISISREFNHRAHSTVHLDFSRVSSPIRAGFVPFLLVAIHRRSRAPTWASSPSPTSCGVAIHRRRRPSPTSCDSPSSFDLGFVAISTKDQLWLRFRLHLRRRPSSISSLTPPAHLHLLPRERSWSSDHRSGVFVHRKRSCSLFQRVILVSVSASDLRVRHLRRSRPPIPTCRPPFILVAIFVHGKLSSPSSPSWAIFVLKIYNYRKLLIYI